jgi:rhodanese-related sulfurtransferase
MVRRKLLSITNSLKKLQLMINAIKNMLGLGPKVDLAEIAKQGAIILDVRSKGEYAGGHIRGSINISADTLSNNLSKLKDKNKPIITCCASGMRSASAKSILTSNGYTQVYNGGGWNSLQNKLR